MPVSNLRHVRRFRTYEARRNASVNCKIWEAARATTAAPTFFKRISIGEGGPSTEDFIDAGVGYNNPVFEVIEEACELFGNERRAACFISLGSGHAGPDGLQQPGIFQEVLPIDLVKRLEISFGPSFGSCVV